MQVSLRILHTYYPFPAIKRWNSSGIVGELWHAQLEFFLPQSHELSGRDLLGWPRPERQLRANAQERLTKMHFFWNNELPFHGVIVYGYIRSVHSLGVQVSAPSS